MAGWDAGRTPSGGHNHCYAPAADNQENLNVSGVGPENISELWLIEQVIELGDAYARGKLLGLLMLAHFGAQERTGEECRALLEAAGFANVSGHPGEASWSIVEAIRP